MDLYKKILEAGRNELLIDELNDLIEYDDLSISNIESGLSLLIKNATAEQIYSIQESMLNLSTSIMYKCSIDVDKLDLDILENSLPKLKHSSLENALFILGRSKKSKYLQSLKKFVYSEDEFTSSTALEAIKELEAGIDGA
ncbi:hypothetical protein [Clostridium amazonitimonense]|uniref:hypothetical protein n=1 Tax=Clostridium amazonitimonense TaxID=1499689 RepID=UPI0005097BB2|nr:hypothetical protein [Clostridium amazonitimonense]